MSIFNASDSTAQVTYTDGGTSTLNLPTGAVGSQGPAGAAGRGIISVTNTSPSTAQVAYTDGGTSTLNLPTGAVGSQGPPGKGIVSITNVTASTARVTYTDSTTSTLNLPTGAVGAVGAVGPTGTYAPLKVAFSTRRYTAPGTYNFTFPTNTKAVRGLLIGGGGTAKANTSSTTSDGYIGSAAGEVEFYIGTNQLSATAATVVVGAAQGNTSITVGSTLFARANGATGGTAGTGELLNGAVGFTRTGDVPQDYGFGFRPGMSTRARRPARLFLGTTSTTDLRPQVGGGGDADTYRGAQAGGVGYAEIVMEAYT
jgi:hypothetical protein